MSCSLRRPARFVLGAGVAATAAWALARSRRASGGSDAGRAPRVTLATRLYAPEPAAAALRLRGLARALAEQGAQVQVLTSTPDGMTAPQDPGVTVHSAPALRDENGYILGYAQYMSFDIPLAARLLTGPKPDLLIAEPPPTTGIVTRTVAALRGIPYAYYAADVWSDAVASTGAPAWVGAALRFVESQVLRHATPVLAVSDGVAERVRALGARDVVVVPNGIDTDTFTTTGPVASEAPSAPYFLYAGTASTWQGAGIFIDALRIVHEQVPEARLVYLGQGSDWDAIAERAGDDERIILRDLVPAPEAAAWQRGAVASVVSIQPGLGYDFAYPTKIFAALACGTPVVYAGPGPARDELPAHHLGWAVEYDAEAIAAAMLEALHADEAEDRNERREARRAWVCEHRSMQTELAKAASRLLHH